MKARLSKDIWLDQGLKTLAEQGFEALKADPMAKALQVSRGSFYWHFTDISAFHHDLLAHWQRLVTQRVIEQVGQLSDGKSKVTALLTTAFESDPRLERAVRSWAIQNNHAADVAASVDQKRVEFLTQLLIKEGVPETTAPKRALGLYWAYLGQTMTQLSYSTTLTRDDLEQMIAPFIRTP